MNTNGRFQAPWWLCAALTLLACLMVGRWGPVGERLWMLPGAGPGPAAFLALFALLWAVSIALLIVHPTEESFAEAAWRILLLAAAARLLLFGHPPTDDVYRYLWEGRMVSEGISPYGVAPADPSLSAVAGSDPYWSRINHPHMPAAYPPVVLTLFAVAGKVAYHPASMKALAVAADLGTAAMILMLLARRGLSARWVVIYAFNPVVLMAFAGQGHFDAIQNLLVAAALVLYDRKRWRAMFLMLGLAFQIKYVAIVAVPFLVRKENARHLWVGALAAVLPLVPYFWLHGAGLFSSLARFGTGFAFNGPIHSLLRWGFSDAIGPATAICGALLAAALAGAMWKLHPAGSARFSNDPVSGVFFAFGALVLLSPTVHFWYLTWVLVFLPLRPTLSWLVLSLTAGAYFVTYTVFHQTGQWRLPTWAFAVHWLPFFILLCVDGARFAARMRCRAAESPSPPAGVSVVIPAKNEAEWISQAVDAARQDEAVCEVIVVDGGSTDATRSLAAAAGAQVLLHKSPPGQGGGRGGQIRHGIFQSRGAVVAVVHADTVVLPPGFSRMVEVLARQPMVSGGTLGGGFESRRWSLRLVSWANDLRAALFGIGFGDQVQFFRREPVAGEDLFPDLPLMEDVEMSLRLQRIGRVVHLFGNGRISDRRWQSAAAARTRLVLRLFFGYLLLRPFCRPDTAAMYRKYYQ